MQFLRHPEAEPDPLQCPHRCRVVLDGYGDSIPDSLDNTVFLEIVRDKIPADYYEALQKYGLVIDPKKTYYLLKAFDRESNKLILFDYSCTPEVDGPVLLYPQEYDTEHLEKYDKCRQTGN